jgi:hypothetical protein
VRGVGLHEDVPRLLVQHDDVAPARPRAVHAAVRVEQRLARRRVARRLYRLQLHQELTCQKDGPQYTLYGTWGLWYSTAWSRD